MKLSVALMNSLLCGGITHSFTHGGRSGKDCQCPPLNLSFKRIEAEPRYDIEKICRLFGHSAYGQARRCD